MDRGWYFRFALVLGLALFGVGALWPSVDEWVPAPQWLKDQVEGRISPGLDIQGGLRLMYEVGVDEAIASKRDRLAETIVAPMGQQLGILTEDQASSATRELLDQVLTRVEIDRVEGRQIHLTFDTAADADKITRDWLRSEVTDELTFSRQGLVIELEIRDDLLDRLRQTAVQEAVKAIENRIDELAIKEMTVIGRDSDIIIELPGGDPVSRTVTTLAGMAATEVPTADGAYRFTVTEADLAERSGLSATELQEALTDLAQAGASLRMGDGYAVISDLDEFKRHSVFERVRSIISRTAQLSFKVLEDEATFVAGLSDLPDGIEQRSETVSAGLDDAGQERPATASYLYASGAGSRERLADYIDTLELPENRDLLMGRSEQPAEGDEEAWRTYYMWATTEVTGEQVDDAYVGTDENGAPVVLLQFNREGAGNFSEMTGRNTKRRMAIVLDDRVESAPVINERIGARCQISLGRRSQRELTREANDLVIVLKAGALPAPIVPSNEQLIGPTLGRDAVEQGAEGALFGIGFVLLFMLLYYQVAGFVADLMVLLNLLLLLATLAFFEATLTLPGVAGIALTIGMAVDANVLITERIREELRLGKSPRAAVDHGFRRAFWSIFDSQVTTFIAGIVLYQYGTGPIRGFAVTLMIGIATSLVTGVFCSKVVLDWLVRGLRVRRLRVG